MTFTSSSHPGHHLILRRRREVAGCKHQTPMRLSAGRDWFSGKASSDNPIMGTRTAWRSPDHLLPIAAAVRPTSTAAGSDIAFGSAIKSHKFSMIRLGTNLIGGDTAVLQNAKRSANSTTDAQDKTHNACRHSPNAMIGSKNRVKHGNTPICCSCTRTVSVA